MLAYDPHCDRGLWLDHTLIGSDDVTIGVSSFNLKQDEVGFAFVDDL